MLSAQRALLFFLLATMLALCAASPVFFERRVAVDAAEAPKTNAERLRRGLAPLKPRKAFGATPVDCELFPRAPVSLSRGAD